MKATFARETRYMTRGIGTGVPMPLIAFLWQKIDDRSGESATLDYLQVFKFDRIADGLYAIRHTQENPDMTSIFYVGNDLGVESVVGKTIFVIDDGDHSTMLFADEY